jgi:HlyD family secretion protein
LPSLGATDIRSGYFPESGECFFFWALAESVGQEALVRLSALNQRITPTVGASVIYVSADALAEQMQVKNEARPDSDTRREFYVVRVRLDQDDILKRMPEFIPTPGMPADVYIKTGERTFFEYIMKPVFNSFSRAFRET